jgi:hypothetical protein
VTVWVVNAAGASESRQLDLGLIDGYFAEALGDVLQEGDKVIVRARAAGRK